VRGTASLPTQTSEKSRPRGRSRGAGIGSSDRQDLNEVPAARLARVRRARCTLHCAKTPAAQGLRPPWAEALRTPGPARSPDRRRLPRVADHYGRRPPSRVLLPDRHAASARRPSTRRPGSPGRSATGRSRLGAISAASSTTTRPAPRTAAGLSRAPRPAAWTPTTPRQTYATPTRLRASNGAASTAATRLAASLHKRALACTRSVSLWAILQTLAADTMPCLPTAAWLMIYSFHCQCWR
jgi:hypothetical protein